MAAKKPVKPVKKAAPMPGTGAPAPVATAFGQDITAPAAPSPVPTPGLTGPIQTALMTAQNAANQANQQRYTQQLGVLNGGNASSSQFLNTGQGYLSDALKASQGLGASEKDTIARQLANANGSSAQSALSRGIYNTTALNGMQNENQRVANSANLQADENVLNRQIGVNQSQASMAATQASNANQGAGSIASAIAARNDIPPDPMAYAQAQRAAVPGATPQIKPTIRITRPSGGIMGGGGGSFMDSINVNKSIFGG